MDTITSDQLNIVYCNLVGRWIVQKILADFEFEDIGSMLSFGGLKMSKIDHLTNCVVGRAV